MKLAKGRQSKSHARRLRHRAVARVVMPLTAPVLNRQLVHNPQPSSAARRPPQTGSARPGLVALPARPPARPAHPPPAGASFRSPKQPQSQTRAASVATSIGLARAGAPHESLCGIRDLPGGLGRRRHPPADQGRRGAPGGETGIAPVPSQPGGDALILLRPAVRAGPQARRSSSAALGSLSPGSAAQKTYLPQRPF